jgi:hypothetical protein
VSLLSPFSSLVMQTPIFLTKLSDESIIYIIDVGKKYLLTSEQSEMFCEFVDRGQIFCSESFFKSVFKILSEY